MYRRPKFLEVLLDIRIEMAHEVDFDTDLFAEMIRTGRHTAPTRPHSLVLSSENATSGKRQRAPENNGDPTENDEPTLPELS